jgi:hypothetical protein
MLLITRHDHRLDISVHGKLDRASMKAALNDFEAKSAGIEHGVMRYNISGFEFPTPGALAEEMSRLPLLLSLVRRFDRAAIVADEAWIRRFSEWEGKLVPGIQIKAFRHDQEDEAEAWLTAVREG